MKLNELLGIEFPFIQGGMANIATAEFAAAVSNAGGLGIIGAGGMPPEVFQEHIRRCRTLTDRPFGVNIMLMHPQVQQLAEIAAAEKVAVITTGAGDPSRFIPMWKESGAKVFPVVPAVALAKLVARAGADGVIVQDLAVFNYIVDHFADMEAHCSTQMGIDDAEGALLFKELGAKRIVLARETGIEQVKEIKKAVQIPPEIFIHGALCVSYSGNCLMSGLIGYRSGNRGRGVGSCRKHYDLIDKTTGRSLGKSYLLSTKDLNTIDYIDELKEIDSLKIEGRMKEPSYVANVVAGYRAALDGTLSSENKENLKKTFNRTFTKGYLFHEDPKDITNIEKPNNFGYEIGRVSRYVKGMYEIRLNSVLNQNDIIRIDHEGEDVNLSVVKLYDSEGSLINKSDDVCYIKIKERLSTGDIVYKTKDYLFYKELEDDLDKEFRRFDLDLKVYAYPGSHLVIDAEGLGVRYLYEGDEILDQAEKKPTGREQIVKQLGRLGDTIFTLGNVEFEEYNAFIPVKQLNNARRRIVQALYDLKLSQKQNRKKERPTKRKVPFSVKKPYLTASVTSDAQYNACRACGIEEIYFHNVIRRNQNTY